MGPALAHRRDFVYRASVGAAALVGRAVETTGSVHDQSADRISAVGAGGAALRTEAVKHRFDPTGATGRQPIDDAQVLTVAPGAGGAIEGFASVVRNKVNAWFFAAAEKLLPKCPTGSRVMDEQLSEHRCSQTD